MSIKRGQLFTLDYEDRGFDAIVVDSDGLGKGRPSICFGFRMMERHGGLPTSTIDNWLEGVPNNDSECLKVPSGKTFRVSRIFGVDGNEYVVLEVSEWVALAADVLKNPGKLRKSTRDSLIDFLSWFAIKGFYADAYASLKGSYTDADNRAVSAWMRSRLAGITMRNEYTKFLQDKGCEEWYEYANWTNYIYIGLFGKKAKQMKEEWELVEGNKNIGRNYIPEAKGLEAVAHCEDMTPRFFVRDNLKEAHDEAIKLTRRKYIDID
jgi:hypothetical protein